MKETFLYGNDIEISDELWNDIEKHIPGVKGKWGGVGEQNRDFIMSVLYLAKNKMRRSGSLDWFNLPDNRASYNRRFTNWRNKGIWEELLCILLQHEEFHWLSSPFIYSVFLTNYRLVTAMNQIYLTTADEISLDEINKNTDLEGIWRLKRLYPRYMKNRERRAKSNAQNPRGAYVGKYSIEEIPFEGDISKKLKSEINKTKIKS